MALAAGVQMNSTDDVPANIARAEQLLKAAAEQGAQLAPLPEMFLSLHATHYATIATDTFFLHTLAQWERQYIVWLVPGAVPQSSPDGRFYSASLVFRVYGDRKSVV